jgi:hypothetical protein
MMIGEAMDRYGMDGELIIGVSMISLRTHQSMDL